MVFAKQAHDSHKRGPMGMVHARGMLEAYIWMRKDMYDGAKTQVRVVGGDAKYLSVKMGLHQESILDQFNLPG